MSTEERDLIPRKKSQCCRSEEENGDMFRWNVGQQSSDLLERAQFDTELSLRTESAINDTGTSGDRLIDEED